MRAMLLIALVGASSCAPDRDEGDIVITWSPGGSAVADSLRDMQIMESYADALNRRFRLPQDLPIVHRQCGSANAKYVPQSREVVLCYELLDQIAAQHADEESDEQYAQRVEATWTFVFFHELGHALIDLYGLHTTGRQEDAVDDFASVLLIESQQETYALLAADFWRPTTSDDSTIQSPSDEHSFDAQRYYNMLCLVYGSAPERHLDLIVDGALPVERAERCPSEYQEKLSSWRALLKPWLKG
jgi:hypothetical protein